MSAPTAASKSTAWWLAYPGFLQAELAGLAAAGATWHDGSPIDPALGMPGDLDPRATLRVQMPHPLPAPGDPVTLCLSIRYPDAFPWFPPRVRLPEPLSGLNHHRNPVDGSLCLLANDDDWRPGTTLADLLAEQLPRLLTAGRATGAEPATLALEAGVEPVWTRLRPSLGGLLVDSSCLPPPDVPAGLANLLFVGTALNPIHALVTLLDAERQMLWSTDVFGAGTAELVPWVRLPNLPAGPLEAADLWKRALGQAAQVLPAHTGAPRELLLVLVGSEGDGRRPCEEFLLLTRPAGGADLSAPGSGAEHPQPADPTSSDTTVSAQQLPLFDPEPDSSAGAAGARGRARVLRSWPFGRTDLAARLPGDQGARLAETSVTVVGVGAIGGPLAFELARAGVGRLHLIDGDVHDPATSSRQLLGVRHAGDLKVLGVAARLLGANPHTHVTVAPHHLGADGETELPRLRGDDLVIDATATLSVPRYLAAHLRLTGTPLLIASATAGGWGGTIVSLPADGGGCWECLQLHRADRRSLPWPPARPDGQLIPLGCSHPTYVGGYPELGHVALQTARTALALLTRQHPTSAPSPFGDLQVLTLQTRGGPVHPRWQARALTVHAACPLHEPASNAPSGRQRRASSDGRGRAPSAGPVTAAP